MPVFRLREDEVSFPNPRLAEKDGLLAVGGDLSVERLLGTQMGFFLGIIQGKRLCGGARRSGF